MTVAGCPTSDTRKCYQKTNKTPSVNIGFSATNALKKKKIKNEKSTLDVTEINNFRKNAKAMITNIVTKLSDCSIAKLNLSNIR